jgi:hypothetical protein
MAEGWPMSGRAGCIGQGREAMRNTGLLATSWQQSPNMKRQAQAGRNLDAPSTSNEALQDAVSGVS